MATPGESVVRRDSVSSLNLLPGSPDRSSSPALPDEINDKHVWSNVLHHLVFKESIMLPNFSPTSPKTMRVSEQVCSVLDRFSATHEEVIHFLCGCIHEDEIQTTLEKDLLKLTGEEHGEIISYLVVAGNLARRCLRNNDGFVVTWLLTNDLLERHLMDCINRLGGWESFCLGETEEE